MCQTKPDCRQAGLARAAREFCDETKPGRAGPEERSHTNVKELRGAAASSIRPRRYHEGEIPGLRQEDLA